MELGAISITYQKLRIYTLQRLGYSIIQIIAKLDNNVWKEKMYLRVLLHESERKKILSSSWRTKKKYTRERQLQSVRRNKRITFRIAIEIKSFRWHDYRETSWISVNLVWLNRIKGSNNNFGYHEINLWITIFKNMKNNVMDWIEKEEEYLMSCIPYYVSITVQYAPLTSEPPFIFLQTQF